MNKKQYDRIGPEILKKHFGEGEIVTKGDQKHSSHLQEEAAQKGSRACGTLLTIAIVLVIVNHLFLAGAALYDYAFLAVPFIRYLYLSCWWLL
ncbi:MAG TPA: hypothetical protein EYH05_07330 [Anaerolineae bacterium]|nr:hypothetical protein [Anaerolineae bacterium]